MANNYLGFSRVIENLTPEEIRWWKNETNNTGKDFDENKCICYDVSLEEDNRLVWFHTCGPGDVELVAEIVQKFLKQLRKNDFFSLTWSCTCSTPRIGEFTGGGIFVTANEMKFFSISEWIEQAKKEWSDKQ